jgi:hypothetical protein
MRSNRQSDATHGKGFRLFPPVRAGAICDRLLPVAATGLHKGSIVRYPIDTLVRFAGHVPQLLRVTTRGDKASGSIEREQAFSAEG